MTEDQLEQEALRWLASVGYTPLNARDLDHLDPRLERGSTRDLTEASQSVQKEPTLVDLEVSRWISEWIGSESTTGAKRGNGSALMKLLSPLSLHGGMNILWY